MPLPDSYFSQAEQICDDIARTVSGSSNSRSKKLPDALRYSECHGHTPRKKSVKEKDIKLAPMKTLKPSH